MFTLRHTGIAMLLALATSPVAAQDLTGIWRDNTGGRYVVRQAGEEFCWTSDQNVFCGIITGPVIAGSWLDLPTGRFRGNGRMVLQIASPNRLVKLYQTANYTASTWTREGSSDPTPAAQPSAVPRSEPAVDPSLCRVAGKWIQTTNLGTSTWNVDERGNAKEEGFGGAEGTATLNGKVMTIKWHIGSAWAGSYTWTLDEACRSGNGDLVFTVPADRASEKSAVTHSQPTVETSTDYDIARAPQPITRSEPAVDPLLCRVAGRWIQSTANVGTSTWNVDERGNAREVGLGGGEGTATLNGKVMTIKWHIGNEWAGSYTWKLDQACRSGNGDLVFTAPANRASEKSTVTHSQ